MRTFTTASLRSCSHHVQDRSYGPARGFTLTELLIVIAVAAILLSVAAPSFKTTQQRWRVNSVQQAYASSLYMARRAAIKHGGQVLMQRRTPDTNCPHVTEARNWGCGWDICFDTDGNGQCTAPQVLPQPTDDVLLQSVASPGHTNVRLSANTSRLKFDAWGHPNGLGVLGVTFSPAHETADSAIVSTLCMSSGGRIRFVRAATCS